MERYRLPQLFRLVLLITLLADVKGQTTRTRPIDGQDPVQGTQRQLPENQTLDVIKVDANLVSVPVIVSDRLGRYVPDLKREVFKIFDNDSEQTITYFDAAEEPLSVALLLDTSRSTEGVLDEIKKAAKNFIKQLRPQDRAMIVSFDFAIHHLSQCRLDDSNHAGSYAQSGRTRQSGDNSSKSECVAGDIGLTSNRKALEKAIGKAKVGEFFGTTLNDVVMEVASRDFKNVTGRKAIILLSDGQDHGSVVSTAALLDAETESDTMVYSVFYASAPGRGFRKAREAFPFPTRRGPRGIFRPLSPDQLPSGPQRRQGQVRRNIEGAELLRELAERTSGRFYRSELTNLNQTFLLIAEELRHQYRLGFYPGEIKRDGNLHALRVKVDAMDVAVRARRYYRART